MLSPSEPDLSTINELCVLTFLVLLLPVEANTGTEKDEITIADSTTAANLLRFFFLISFTCPPIFNLQHYHYKYKYKR